MARLSFVAGVEGATLSDRERDFFAETAPLGLILFARNLESEEQIRRLVGDVRDAAGVDDFWVMIDQEGGRVQRLRPPLFPALPSFRKFGALFESDPGRALEAVNAISRLMGQRLLALGINVNCTPVLDVHQPKAHEVIGDRSFGSDVEAIAKLGREVAVGHMASGVLPVIKHIPGHGRANADSHKDLPVIDAPLDELRRVDFAPFKVLRDMPIAMTAHVIYEAFERAAPVSVSDKAISALIREEIGFDGFLICDDVSMEALDGSIAARTAAVLAAGCDGALHCNGDFDEMTEVAQNSPVLAGQAALRFQRSFDMISKAEPFDEADALALLDEAWCGL